MPMPSKFFLFFRFWRTQLIGISVRQIIFTARRFICVPLALLSTTVVVLCLIAKATATCPSSPPTEMFKSGAMHDSRIYFVKSVPKRSDETSQNFRVNFLGKEAIRHRPRHSIHMQRNHKAVTHDVSFQHSHTVFGQYKWRSGKV